MKKLFFFYGTECPHCIVIEKFVDKLISEGIDIEKMEVWHNTENENLMVSLDKDEDMCGGVPFFYNENNKKTICGEATYEEIKSWAKSQ